MALTQDVNRPERAGDLRDLPVKAGVTLYAGALACLQAGVLVPGQVATNLVAVGRVDARADNTGGADGAIRATVRRGVFRFKNSAAGDLIAAADIGADCFIVDDETVAKTNGAGTRSRAGRVFAVEPAGVWVEIL